MVRVFHRLLLLVGCSIILISPCSGQVTAGGRTNVVPFPIEESQFRGDSASIQLQKSIRQSATTGKNWLFTIGIAEYRFPKDWQNLTNPVNDAKTIRDLLTRKYRFDLKRTRELYNKDATRERIYEVLASLREEIKADDNLMIYFAGHGKLDQVDGRGYWIPADAKRYNSANYISVDDLKPWLRTIKARSILIISDACFSSALFRGAEPPRWRYDNPNNYFERISRSPARYAITSGGEEPVLDEGGNVPHSVFAWHLMQALEKNDESYLPASKLFDLVEQPVAKSASQVPQLFRLSGEYGQQEGEFIFFKK